MREQWMNDDGERMLYENHIEIKKLEAENAALKKVLQKLLDTFNCDYTSGDAFLSVDVEVAKQNIDDAYDLLAGGVR